VLRFESGSKARADGDPAAVFDLFNFAWIMCMLQATTLGVMGDAIAQRLERRWNPGQRYELKRTVHAGILNMIIGTKREISCFQLIGLQVTGGHRVVSPLKISPQFLHGSVVCSQKCYHRGHGNHDR